ncbi:aldehyde dehydrogenase [Actinoplanes sp. OR16]|uniref:aldehyde dehydrogenase (NADP(+)) n=1 Tax=Actinoplanes sp. OR16 TaxID=946334 RepID=UPI000F6E459B|nr:aldehyde dehydrogenase (NADP(+)) [Actinoplanes sp. OR16]BBH71794.1 aldehyde dehydrogenase [Actinoplanes sp. OR16]
MTDFDIPADRAALLHAVADALDAAADELIPLAAEETHLPHARLTGELARTTFQLRLYAGEIAAGRVHDIRSDPADPGWPSGPRPALTRVRVPIGPVLIFAASNFPFAFSVAGTDTAAALAAGCPVVVKAHPGHPRLSRRVAALVGEVLPDGVFELIEGEQEGRDALLDPRIKAAAFTGSLHGGRALFDLAASRPSPIPFYGELGSVNPVFVTEAAFAARGPEILEGWVGSFTLGLGQFCTKPGVILVPAGSSVDLGVAGGALLNSRIAAGHREARAALAAHPAVRVLVAGDADDTSASPALLATDVASFLTHLDELLVEVFGPTALLVEYTGEQDLLAVARRLPGQLTATVHAPEDDPLLAPLLTELAQHAGRVVLNGWPTGVAVSPAMHHGGPYPATTAPLHTSVGTAAIDRFLRPVTFQNVPASFVKGLA